MIAKDCSHDTIVIGGYTDLDGSESYNKNLSQKRANTVKNYLVDNNISPSQLESIGYGEIDPIADNNTSETKEKNIRIEFNIKRGG